MKERIDIELNTGQTWSPTDEQIQNWQKAYTGLDVRAELRKAGAWVASNPAKRKTARGVASFCVNWLSRANDRGGSPSQYGSKFDKPAIPQAKPFDPDLARHLWAADMMVLARFAGTPPPEKVSRGTYRFNLNRLIDAVDRGEVVDTDVNGKGWLNEKSRRSAVYGTVSREIIRGWNSVA